jgi:hypothetical protein
LYADLSLYLALGAKEESHTAATHAPSIQKPQKSLPNSPRTRPISMFVYRLPAHGIMV